MAEDLFLSFGLFGDRVLEGLNRGDRSARKFKYLVGVINQTLVTTHEMVITRLAEVQQAQTIDEAKALLENLRLDELTEAFRLEGLCDLLEGLGTGLLGGVWRAQSEGSFEDAELTEVEEFGQRLYDREAEVARLYSDVLSDVTRQGAELDAASLPELRQRAAEVESLLTNHVSDFKAKADRFMRLSTREAAT